MKIVLLLSVLLQSSGAMRLRTQDFDLGSDDDSGPPPWVYVPTNTNTKAPIAFSDEIVADEGYHELVPALQVLSDLTTTRAPSSPR